jgi:hypothetical protein
MGQARDEPSQEACRKEEEGVEEHREELGEEEAITGKRPEEEGFQGPLGHLPPQGLAGGHDHQEGEEELHPRKEA